jgi:hypothetical protein
LAHPNIGYSNATPSGSFLSKPGIGSVLVGEDLQVVDVADLFRGVDVDPDRHVSSLICRNHIGDANRLLPWPLILPEHVHLSACDLVAFDGVLHREENAHVSYETARDRGRQFYRFSVMDGDILQ